MSSTHSALDYHIVFSTKNRFPMIDPAWREDLHRFLGGCIRQAGGVAAMVGGTSDHVHIAAGLRPTDRIADVLRDVKRASSALVHERFGVTKFAWQEGYGAFTFSRRDLPAVVAYVSSQEEHHRRRTFQEEYRAFLEGTASPSMNATSGDARRAAARHAPRAPEARRTVAGGGASATPPDRAPRGNTLRPGRGAVRHPTTPPGRRSCFSMTTAPLPGRHQIVGIRRRPVVSLVRSPRRPPRRCVAVS